MLKNFLLLQKKNISELSDESLLQQYNLSGDTEYFGTLYNRYIPLLYGLCLKYLQDTDRSQDAVMQLFEDLLPKISNFQIKTFKTWLYSVAKNHCLQILRKESKEISVDFNVNFVESDSVMHLLSEENDNEERITTLNHCIGKLPQPQQVCIVHFFMDELSYADIVDQTGFQLKSVKSHIQNGKRNLKICIEKQSDR